MAHKLAHRLQSTGDRSPGDGPEDSGSTGLTRRSYTRISGAALASLAALAGRTNGVVSASTEDADESEHRLRIRGSGTPSTYEVTVGGGLVADEETSRVTGHVSGSTAEGAVTSDDRGYRFRGELRDVTVDGDAEVSLDGESLER